ncbi:MAG: hypothetical protein Q9226_004665 [Calogaya cf. arnoldii]
MSYSSSYSETCALAARVRDKFQCQYGTKKDQNLRLIVAHAQLYDRLDDHIGSLRKIRELNARGENPFAPAVAVPNHQDSFRMNQQANLQRNRPNSPKNSPCNPPNLADEHAVEDGGDAKPSSKPSDPIVSVSIGELEDSEDLDHEDITSEPHASPGFMGTPFTMMTNKSIYRIDYTFQTVISETAIDDPSDSESDSEGDFDGDLDSGLSFYAQPMKTDSPVPMSKPNTSQPCIRWQDQESNESLKMPDMIAQEPPEIEDLPTLQRCGPSMGSERGKKETPEPERTPRSRAAAPNKTEPLEPLLCNGVTSDMSAEVDQEYGLHEKALHRLVDCQRDGEDTSAILSTIRKIPSLPYWISGGGKTFSR